MGPRRVVGLFTPVGSRITLVGMDTLAAQACAHRLMAEHGLTRRGWTFAFNRRKRSLGLCRYHDRRIELSVWFVAGNDPAMVRDTILHEIAHALVGHAAGHGPKWVAACLRIGASPQRLCPAATMPAGPYRAVCPACHQQHHRHRRPIRARRYYCRACGPDRGPLRFNTHRPACSASS